MKITSAQENKIREIAEKYNLKLALVFGSQVTGEITEESDVDIAVLPRRSLTFREEIMLNSELVDVLGNVDMVNLRKASPLLLKEVIDNYQILYQSQASDFSRFEVYALQRYAEAKPIFEMHQESINKFLQEV